MNTTEPTLVDPPTDEDFAISKEIAELSFSEMWRRFENECLPQGLDPITIETVRSAFVGGAMLTLNVVTTEDENEEKHEARCRAFQLGVTEAAASFCGIPVSGPPSAPDASTKEAAFAITRSATSLVERVKRGIPQATAMFVMVEKRSAAKDKVTCVIPVEDAARAIPLLSTVIAAAADMKAALEAKAKEAAAN